MAYQLTLLNPKFRKWVKAGIALNVTRDGIEYFVEKNNNAFHTSVISKLSVGAVCISCSTGNVVPCRSQNNLCKFSSGSCLVHVSSNKFKVCGASVCNSIQDEITRKHRYQPNFKNTDARKWCNNGWEIAKCYMADGYESKSTAADTDLAGLLSVVINNKAFQAAVTSSLTNKNNIFCQARETRNEILHNASMEVTDIELRDYINTMILLLSDPKYLAADPGANKAIYILNQIQTDILTITTEYEITVREESRKAIEELKQQALREINDISQKTLNAIKDETSKMSKDMETKLENQIEKCVSMVRRERTDNASKLKCENDKAIVAIRNERVINKQDIKREKQKAVISIRKERMEVKDEAAKVIMDIRKERQIIVDTLVREDIDHHSTLIQKMRNELNDLRKEFKTTQCASKEGHYAIRASKLVVHDVYNQYKADLQSEIISLYMTKYSKTPFTEKKSNSFLTPRIIDYACGNTCAFVNSFKDIFTQQSRNIYLAGVAGSGKSIFCGIIISAWCRGLKNVKPSMNGLHDDEMVTSYDFMFYIPFRGFHYNATSVEEIIRRGILSLMSDDVSGASEILFSAILRREKCLIICDGLDENCLHCLQAIQQRDWNSKYDCLITSRTRKLNKMLMGTQSLKIDTQFELFGIDIYLSLNEVLKMHSKHIHKTQTIQSLKTFVVQNSLVLDKYVGITDMLCILFSQWLGREDIGEIHCVILSDILNYMFEIHINRDSNVHIIDVKIDSSYSQIELPECFNKAEACHEMKTLLYRLSDIAYHQTIRQIIVFQSNACDLCDLDLKLCIQIGIITVCSIQDVEHCMSFVHTAYQEFLTALYVILNKDSLRELNKLEDIEETIPNAICYLRGMKTA